TSYVAGDSPGTKYWPESLLIASRRRPVSGFTTVTVAFGRTAPVESVTVPVISPDAPTPWARATVAVNRKVKITTGKRSFWRPRRSIRHLPSHLLNFGEASHFCMPLSHNSHYCQGLTHTNTVKHFV